MRSKIRSVPGLVLYFLSTISSAQIDHRDSIPFPDNKAVLYEFTASWCVPCKQMEATTLKDSSVLAYIDSNYTWVVVDVDRPEGKKLASALHVNQYPTFIAMDPASNELFLRILGYKPADIFLNDLKFALKYTRFEKK